jgi:heme a synthase
MATSSSLLAINGSEVAATRVWLPRFATFVAFATVLLIFMGARVTSHGAGLAVPDWPTTFGENMFTFAPSKWVGGIFHEHFHRLFASAVGALTVILAIWIWSVESRRWVRWFALAAVVTVIAQGVLGGLTVKFLLPAWISSLHALTGQSFLLLTIVLAYSQSKDLLAYHFVPDRHVFRGACILIVLLYVQLLLGAFMRHTEAGLAVPDFPTMAGEWVPSIAPAALDRINEYRSVLHLEAVSAGQVLVHLLHRAGALLVFLGSLYMLACARRSDPSHARLAWGIFTVVLFQATLGILTVISARQPEIASLHVVFGAVILGATTLLALRSYSWRLWRLHAFSRN